MPYSARTEEENLFNIFEGKISVRPTRAVVVSNRDPLFCGRVKVWIPAIHGLYGDDSTADNSKVKEPAMPPGGLDPSKINLTGLSSDITESQKRLKDMSLPWAKCLGSNWGPRLESSNTGLVSGLFSIPKVGTEVYVIFEEDNPSLPIVIGTIIHANEFSYKPNRPLELFPGVEVDQSRLPISQITLEQSEKEYTDSAASCYSIRAENGSTLLISDKIDSSCILLSGVIKHDAINQMQDSTYSLYKQAYPGFPTTASSPYAARTPIIPELITKYNNTKLSVAGDGSITTTTEPADSGSALDTPSDANISSDKTWPIVPPVGKSVPVYSTNMKEGGGAFGAKRGSSFHIGLDMATPIGTILVAPIALKPIKFIKSETAGNMLLCWSPVDGTGHGFFHLDSVSPAIIQWINEGKAPILPAKTQLGRCGNTGSHTTGAHLHWEVYKKTPDRIETTNDFMTKMFAQAHGKAGISACLDPVLWLREAGSSNSKIVLQSDEQARSMIEHTKHQYGYDSDGSSITPSDKLKPIGLEICTVPGKESIILRHPSGSFLGFDPDGNFIMNSVGDSNIRIARSWNLDVLGGILETCYAKFSRVRTIVKEWAKFYDRARDSKYADKKTYPEFFIRAERQREIDMNDAMRSSLEDAYYVHKNEQTGNTEISSLVDAYKPGGGYVTPASTTARKFTETYYDPLIKKMYSLHITTQELKTIFPDWRYFKAQMLLESNANPKAYVASTQAVGLFQVTPIAIQDVTGKRPSDMNPYFIEESNIDMSFRVTLRNIQYIKAYISKRNTRLNITTQLGNNSLRNLCMLSYVAGPTSVGSLINDPELTSIGISYGDIEALYKLRHKDYQHSLSYVPTIDYIYGKLGN